MNDVLYLKGRFEQKKSSQTPKGRNIPTGKRITEDHLLGLKKQILRVIEYWENDTLLNDKLVCVYYSGVIAKSNRIHCLLAAPGKKTNDTVVGAKFIEEPNGKKKHVMTHCVSIEILHKTVTLLELCISQLHSYFNGQATHDQIEMINKNELILSSQVPAKSILVSVLVDSYYIERIGVELETRDISENALITIYNTGIETTTILRKLNIDLAAIRQIDNTTLLLRPDQYALLKSRAPFLIAMALVNITDITSDDVSPDRDISRSIPDPGSEPTIGVIDTLFDESVYFSKWVDFTSMIDPAIQTQPQDYSHGTKVSSIIVDGPSLNPALDDGCGRFKVRHFGVAAGGKMNSFSIVRAIKEIVATNRDIKVWNMSLGSTQEINSNFISPEAAIIDQIQYEYDVVFVISGTNRRSSDPEEMRLGSPADSINSLIVNSVSYSNKPASYSREGPVLSFFNKPDISYYGGDQDQKISAFGPYGQSLVAGTSFAAPWVARKIAYLIHVIGISREIAKALIIDSAAGWGNYATPSKVVGYGVVPTRIEDIIRSPDDEIRFVLSGISEKYDTYNYNIPIPIYQDGHPFLARATLCYFPKCSRNQGVDYTNTELDLHFGRLKDAKIKPINDNYQSEDGLVYLREEDARSYYRKWDNIKHIGERLSPNCRSKKVYETGLWGISLKAKERLDGGDGRGILFGVVITLKEINGKNRLEEFIQQCSFRGWLVNRIRIENQIEVYNKAEEDIHFE